MFEIWFVGGGMLLSIACIAASVILTMTHKEETPLDKIFARQEKIEALLESAKIWEQIGSRAEAEACIYEVSRLNEEIYEIMGIRH